MKQINIYSFEELSEKAKQTAHENYLYKGDYFVYDSELRATLNAFEKAFNVQFSFDGYDNATIRRYGYEYEYAGEIDDPQRVATFMYNNFGAGVEKGKCYSTFGKWIDGKYNFKSRYSRITKELDNCPLTGDGYDYDILKPFIDCIERREQFSSVDDVLLACVNNWIKAWNNEEEYCSSLEFFAGMAAANDWYFLVDGRVV